MAKKTLRVFLLLLLLLDLGGKAQSFLPVCRNFGPEDYGEDAEFRCATTDHKGTLYFGTNYGIFIYKGEKRSLDKNWKILALPEPDVIYSLYMDTADKRLYVGGQNGFGYFNLKTYDAGEYVSLKEKLPSTIQNAETWHTEKTGNTIVFHTLANLLVFDNGTITSLPAPEKGIFHNVFKTDGSSLLINALDKGWFVYTNKKIKALSGETLPTDRCYSVVAISPTTYLFFFRNVGIYRARVQDGTISAVVKLSGEGLDKVLAEKQVYCAALSADTTKLVIGTLNGGTLLLDRAGNILSDMHNSTAISSCYGLFTDDTKSTWILGKRNLSRLPADQSLMHKDFLGTTVRGISTKENELYVAAANGLYKFKNSAALNYSPEKLVEGDFKKILSSNSTLLSYTNEELVIISGEKISRISSPAPINNVTFINNATWISTQAGLYNGNEALVKDAALIAGKNILQAIEVGTKIYLLVENEGIVECDKEGKTVSSVKFPGVLNAKLFSDGEKLWVSDFTDTYIVTDNALKPVGESKSILWLYKRIPDGGRIKFEFDFDNYANLWLSEPNSPFKKANLFMSPVEVNDVEKAGSNYYLATKTGLYVSKLWSPNTNDRIRIFKLSTDSSTYTTENTVRVPYDDRQSLVAACGLNSFFDSYPNTTYYYRLIGKEDTTWTKSKTGSEINLNSLPWGDYTLEVKVAYGNQLETKIAKQAITILKPWWATWWALLLWILLFLLFIYVIVQISVYRLKRSKIKLEKIVEERTAEVTHQKNEIEAQKEEIEHKNHEITDSINYAQRIQNSLLKDESKLKVHLPEAFILYLPKDIVSGDFYWFAEIEGHIVLAVADCTGHGVPGAFMSMLGVAKLNELAAKNIFMPDKLLHELNHLIVETLGQNIANSDSRDGMDIALISLNKKSRKLFYAGANRPLYIVNKKENAFSEIKPTKLPVGGGQYGENRDYQLHELNINPDLYFYLSTDGYADQFGGPQGKKFMTKRMQQLLTDITALTPSQKKEDLKSKYLDWKGKLEQVDDVCVAGIHIGG